ncbi:MAG: hypothetical protein WBM40_03485 [Thiohalocapsa sp.]
MVTLSHGVSVWPTIRSTPMGRAAEIQLISRLVRYELPAGRKRSDLEAW